MLEENQDVEIGDRWDASGCAECLQRGTPEAAERLERLKEAEVTTSILFQ